MSGRRIYVTAVGALAAGALGVGLAQNWKEPPDSVYDVAVSDGRLAAFTTTLLEGELASELRGGGPFTLLAPTDAAFAELEPGILEEMLKPEHHHRLRAWLGYHIVRGRVGSAQLRTMSSLKTTDGHSIAVRVHQGALLLDDATLLDGDHPAANGLVHVIDAVLQPPGL